jgi:hypothetical protein
MSAVWMNVPSASQGGVGEVGRPGGGEFLVDGFHEALVVVGMLEGRAAPSLIVVCGGELALRMSLEHLAVSRGPEQDS